MKPGGACLVLSARKGINITADCVAEKSSLEEETRARLEESCQDVSCRYGVGEQAMGESQLPRTMEKYGFHQVSTQYLTVNLTPDNPGNSKESVYAMTNAHGRTSLDAAESLTHIAPGAVSEEEVCERKGLIDQRYDKPIELYDLGIKQWDTRHQ